MIIKRDQYLNELIKKKDNGRIKIITGVRRCGKSFLLFNLYKSYLLQNGVKDGQIIEIALDDVDHIQYRNPYVTGPAQPITFVDTLLGLMKNKNLDIYVTGSNSTMLSKDILTQFRDRGDEIHVYPLSFSEVSGLYEDRQGLGRNMRCLVGCRIFLTCRRSKKKAAI